MSELAQLIGLVGFAMGLFAFSRQDDREMKGYLMLATLVFTVHFALLEAWVATATMGLTAIRAGVAMYSRAWSWAITFIALQLILSLTLMTQWLELLPLLNGLIGIFAMFRLQGASLRMGMLICGVLGVAYILAVGSIGGSLMDTLVVIMNLATIARLRKTAQQAPVQAQEV